MPSRCVNAIISTQIDDDRIGIILFICILLTDISGYGEISLEQVEVCVTKNVIKKVSSLSTIQNERRDFSGSLLLLAVSQSQTKTSLADWRDRLGTYILRTSASQMQLISSVGLIEVFLERYNVLFRMPLPLKCTLILLMTRQRNKYLSGCEVRGAGSIIFLKLDTPLWPLLSAHWETLSNLRCH
jgi:hypothetical protein